MTRGSSLSAQTSDTNGDWELRSLMIYPLKIEQVPRMSIGTFSCHLNPPDPKFEGPSELLLKIDKFIIFNL